MEAAARPAGINKEPRRLAEVPLYLSRVITTGTRLRSFSWMITPKL
jgi:hypothetical protein